MIIAFQFKNLKINIQSIYIQYTPNTTNIHKNKLICIQYTVDAEGKQSIVADKNRLQSENEY